MYPGHDRGQIPTGIGLRLRKPFAPAQQVCAERLRTEHRLTEQRGTVRLRQLSREQFGHELLICRTDIAELGGLKLRKLVRALPDEPLQRPACLGGLHPRGAGGSRQRAADRGRRGHRARYRWVDGEQAENGLSDRRETPPRIVGRHGIGRHR